MSKIISMNGNCNTVCAAISDYCNNVKPIQANINELCREILSGYGTGCSYYISKKGE
ncbi:hypothetical protein [Bariatricus sp. HCP28S3_H2]|uniref:hypothetical protein n=1 Tax=Bariatricus sp. HCP28S3_H2 TaxID=3438905 RepID=UPI003F898E0C